MDLDVNRRLELAFTRAAHFKPDAYLFTGDFCAHEPVAEVYHRLRARFALLGKPYFLVPGNHDDRGMMRDAFSDHFAADGSGPLFSHHYIGGRSFIFLDTLTGRVEADQIERLAATLERKPDSTLVMHHPPVPLGVRFMDARHPLRETEALLDVLTRGGQRRRVLCGHYHTSRTVSHRNLDIHLCPPTSFFIDPLATEFAMDEQPPGFQLLEWTDGGDFRCTVQATSSAG